MLTEKLSSKPLLSCIKHQLILISQGQHINVAVSTYWNKATGNYIGVLLLEDATGTVTEAIVTKHNRDADESLYSGAHLHMLRC